VKQTEADGAQDALPTFCIDSCSPPGNEVRGLAQGMPEKAILTVLCLPTKAAWPAQQPAAQPILPASCAANLLSCCCTGYCA
jgi:hypothetical protein